MATTTYLALVKAEYEYAAANEEELSISEDQVLYVLEYTDDDWWKVRVKLSPSDGVSPADAPTGLVPASYVVALDSIGTVIALYDYEATSEEEITIQEDALYDLYEKDGDWTLVGAKDKKEVGYAPTAYLEDQAAGAPATNGQATPAASSIPAPPPPPPAPPAPNATNTATPRKTNGAMTDKVLTWSGVTEVDGKKKKKGTLGVGNGSLFFASDSDKAPVQKKDLGQLVDVTTEKSKHIKLSFTTREQLQFTVSKDDLEAIVSKIESSREYAQNGGAGAHEEEETAQEEEPYVIPPPPPPPTAGGAKGFGFLPPPPRRMVSSDSEDSDDDDDNNDNNAPPPSASRSGGAGAVPMAPPPPPAPPAPPAVPAAPRAPTMVIPTAPPAPKAPTSSARPSGKRAKAEYDFTASEPEELSLTEGETLYVLDDSAEDWWKVRNERGEEGEVPASYVEILEDGGSVAAGPAAVDEDADEEAARRLQEEEKAEARREKERLRLKKLEEEARGLGAFDIQPPPARKSTASSAPKSAAPPRAPSPPPAPPAPPVVSPPPQAAPSPARRDTGDRDRDAQREQRRERHKQRERERQTQSAPASAVEKTRPSPSKVRTWIDRTGTFKVDAEFVGLSGPKGEKIRLHKLNGVVIEVPLDKMSQEDVRLIQHLLGRKAGGGDNADAERRHAHRSRGGEQRDRRDRDGGLSPGAGSGEGSHRARPPSATAAGKRVQMASSTGKKNQTDWFEWFLNAGCDIDDCERYARNFEKDRIDETIVGDLEPSTLRSLGLREGDIIRVRKYIASKGGLSAGNGASSSAAPPATPSKDSSGGQSKDKQLQEDEELARKLQEEMNAGRDGSGLFTSASGGVKNTRRGRPQPKSAPSAASVDSIASSLTSGIDRTATPGSERVASPDTTRESSSSSRRPSSAAATKSGFDDDAWTVKPSAKPASPVLIDDSSSTSSARATPSPAPASHMTNRDLAGIRTSSPAMPSNSKEASSAQALTDAYLDSIGLGKRSVTDYGSGPTSRQQASSPALSAQQQQPQQQQQQMQQPQPTGYGMSPQPTGYYQQPQNGPRPPPAPIPLNQQLLNPLIPTQTGMTGFIPTRNQQSPMQMMPQHTSYQPQPQQAMNTGFPGQSPFGNQFAVSPSAPMQQQHFGGMMQPQATGYPMTHQMSHLSIQPTGSPYQMTQSPQPQMHVPQAPPPPPMPVQPQQTSQQPMNNGGSSSSNDLQPANIFAQMKAGQFAKQDASPQQQQKYDALRPQQTSFGGGYGGLQPQPTGFPGQQQQMQPLQAQPTGFAPGGYIMPPQQTGMMPQQTGMMYPQQTGYPYRPY